MCSAGLHLVLRNFVLFLQGGEDKSCDPQIPMGAPTKRWRLHNRSCLDMKYVPCVFGQIGGGGGKGGKKRPFFWGVGGRGGNGGTA